MSLENFVICDGCGARAHPPENAGWQVQFVIAQDGVNVADVEGHLCFECRQEFKRWRAKRHQASAAAAARPS